MRDVLESALGTGVTDLSPISGGDVASSYRVELADGRRVFAKTHTGAGPEFFVTEAAGLRWLRDAHAVEVPEVLAVGDGTDGPPYLVLEWIEEGRAHAGTDAAFGRALADLHRAGAPCFGREDRATTGSRRLPNEPCDSWAAFYATQRLVPLTRLARDSGALPDESIGRLDRVAEQLPDLAGPAADEPPARLHGDLWAGNRLVDRKGDSWLVDPACHGGHREFDLSMMLLFGGYGPDSFAAYREAFPLADGFDERVPLHQLAPLVVHAIKFGGHYATATARALDRLGC